MNRFMSMVAIATLATFNVGCASASGSDYYEAVRKSAEANALASEAKYRALAQVAASGDGQAASAAVMAIAMSQDTPIVPQYVESSALKWAQVLTPTVGTLGLGLIQAGVSKNASDNATKVQMASFATNEAIQLGQQQMVTDLGASWSTAAATSGSGAIEVALAGFDALNNAGDQTVAVATAGLGTAENIAVAGLGSTENVAIAGLAATGTVAVAGIEQVGTTALNGMEGMYLTSVAGMNGMTTLGTAGMDGMTTLGTTGIAATVTMGTAGLTTAEELGKWGMEGIWTTNKDWLTYQTGADTTNAATLTTLVGDANATNLAGQTNYSQIVADMQAALNQMATDLATPLTCQQDAVTGNWSCS